jgi:hypothetical protein
MIAAAGIKVRYRRGRVAAVIDALPGSILFTDEQTSEMEAQIQTKGEAILIRPADLVLGGDLIEPFQGDQIELLDIDLQVIDLWDVRAGNNGQAWDYSDGWRTWFRIFVLRRSSGVSNVARF